ncbi:MAG: hypothetical protein ACYC27_06405 [Armatimonadota bacterium]
MNNAAEVVMASIFCSIFMLGIVVPFWYYAFYERIQKNNIWGKGRKFSVCFQLVNFEISVMIIIFYLFSSYAFDDQYGCAFASLSFGILMFVHSILYYVTIEYYDIFADKYLIPTYFLAPMIASIGLLIKGITWLCDYIPYWFLDHIFITASIGLIVYAEILFLRNNKWKFLPSHPK